MNQTDLVNQVSSDEAQLAVILARYSVNRRGRSTAISKPCRTPRAYYLKLRPSVRLERLADGSQLLELADLFDAMWDASATPYEQNRILGISEID